MLDLLHYYTSRRLLVRVNLLKSEIRPTGDGKIHAPANENIATPAGKIFFFREDEDASSKGGLFLVRQSQVDSLHDRCTKKSLYVTINFITTNSQIYT